MKRNTCVSLIFVIILSCLVIPPTMAENLVNRRPTRGVFGVKVGILSEGAFKADYRRETDLAASGEVFADLPLFRRTYFAIAFDFHKIEVGQHEQFMLDAAAGFKTVIVHRRLDMEFKPWATVGMGHLNKINYYGETNYLSIKLGFETHFAISRKTSWLVELTTLYCPVGGNREYNVIYGPVYMIRFGLALR